MPETRQYLNFYALIILAKIEKRLFLIWLIVDKASPSKTMGSSTKERGVKDLSEMLEKYDKRKEIKI